MASVSGRNQVLVLWSWKPLVELEAYNCGNVCEMIGLRRGVALAAFQVWRK